MGEKERTYIAIDLKSFYASVECADRGFDPLNTNLVVADPTRTEKTICLAVTPSLKAYGISGRARLFEVVQRVKEVNRERRRRAPHGWFTGSSCFDNELKADPSLELDYITAPPRMSLYMNISARIYNIYLRYIAAEDIHVYSVDEVFIDATGYLRTYKTDGRGLAMKLIRAVFAETGITATAGVGTNLYLCKVAMDIVAKHMPPDKDGVRIAELDEMTYRQYLWGHTPITDFWMVGSGTAERLEKYGIYTMGDIARCSLGDRFDKLNPDLLYKLFGVRAQYLIDHAWGYEPCRMEYIKAYRPLSRSMSTGQVLKTPYESELALLIVREMAEQLSFDLLSKGCVTDQLVLTVGYDVENFKYPERMKEYHGAVKLDHYGRRVPAHAHGTVNLGSYTSSAKMIRNAVAELYERIVCGSLLVRRLNIAASRVIRESEIPEEAPRQLDFFSPPEEQIENDIAVKTALAKEKALQSAVLSLKRRYGRNAVLKGMNFEEGATARERNAQIGGHRA
ncbi:MAG: DNA methylase [Ruminococcus sp.]|nr:DNA methylase [Ruminococcus sp.]